MGPTGLSYFLGVAFFRTLVRHRKVKVVFLSEAKILSSEFTFIVNIINFKRLKKMSIHIVHLGLVHRSIVMQRSPKVSMWIVDTSLDTFRMASVTG